MPVRSRIGHALTGCIRSPGIQAGDRLGERFIAGFLLNLGELAYRKEEGIMVMPLSGLWS